MIDLYYWPTPNGWKISIALEELELPYNLVLVNIGRGDQFKPEFLAISPNNRMPAIVDHDPPDGGEPLPIFESAAILIYLAEKTGRLLPPDLRRRKEVLEWLSWQVAGLGPMLGQAHHFQFFCSTLESVFVTGQFQWCCHVFQRSHGWNQVERLKHDPHVIAPKPCQSILIHIREVLSQRLNAAASRLLQPTHQHQQRGFART